MLKLLAQSIVWLIGLYIGFGIVCTIYDFILTIPWLANTLLVIIIIIYLNLLSGIIKRIWD